MNSHAPLIAALEQDRAQQNIRFDLEFAWIRRRLAELPPPPPLQRANHYVFDIHKEALSFANDVRKYPRLLTAIQEHCAAAAAATTATTAAKECIHFLIAFFEKTAAEYWLALPADQIDFGVICLLRSLTTAPAFHAAIRQLILSHTLLRTYGEQRVELYKSWLPLDSDSQKHILRILHPFRDCKPPAEFARDAQFAIAVATIDAFMEDDSYFRLRKGVHLGRQLADRYPLLTAYYRQWQDNENAVPHIEWLAQMLRHADTIEEVADAAAAAGIAVGPSPPGR